MSYKGEGVLIVQPKPELGAVWAQHLLRLRLDPVVVGGADDAIDHLQNHAPSVIVADMDLENAGAIVVADYAAYRRPETRVIFVTARSFFTDGNVFSFSPNAAACLPVQTPPEDLAAVVEFHGRRIAAEH